MSKMKNSFLSTAVAAAFVAGLAGYAYIVEFKQRNEKERRKENDALIVQFDKDKLARVELHRNSGLVAIEQTGGKWMLAEPVRDTVDEQNVNQLVNSLLSERSQETVIEGDAIDWKTYGLDAPVTRLVAKTADTLREVKIGSVKSFDGALYARIGEEKRVLLVDQAWDSHLSKTVTELRDKRFARNPIENYDTISIRGANGTLKLVKRDGKWTFASGGDASVPVADDTVTDYIERVKGLRAVEHVAEDKYAPQGKKFGASGAPTLSVLRGGQPVFTMTVGSLKPSAFGQPNENDEQFRYVTSSDSPVVFKAAKSVAETLEQTPEYFYDKTFPFKLASSEVQKAEILNGSTQVRAKLANGNWTLEAPDAKNELVSDKTQEIVDRLAKLEVYKFRGKARPKGLTSGDRVIRLFDKNGKVLLQVAWGTVYAEKTEGHETKLVDVKTNHSDLTFSLLETDLNALPFKDLLKPKASGALATKQSATSNEKKSN